MDTHTVIRYGSWAALAAGIIGVFAAISLILFFMIEAPRGTESAFRFGFLSDLLPIFAAPLAIAACIVIFRAQQQSAPQWSIAALLLGITGNLILAAVYFLFVLKRITLEQQITGYLIAMAPLGVWFLLVNLLARGGGLLTTRLAIFGILVGVCQLVTVVIYFAVGGSQAWVSMNFAQIQANPPLFVALGIYTLIGLFSYFGSPVWLVWLGRVLAS